MRKQYKNAKTWCCPYCKESFIGRKNLFEHYKYCSVKIKLPKDSKGRIIGDYDHKKQQEKALETKRKNNTLGHSCTDAQRVHIAEAMRNYRKKIGTLHKANVSCIACKYIDELNIQKGWELKHGLQGGEKQVGPYFLDGYDEKRNIAFEYYEKAHHKNQKIEEHDKARARYIISVLHCKFYIYDELFNSFYEFSGD